MSENLCRVITFCSRNKDNQGVEGFHQRSEAFLSNKTDQELIYQFNNFVENGVEGEFCRLYISVNNRDNAKILKNLTHWLIDNPDQDMTKIDSRIASIAAKAECRAEKKWMFDYDEDPTRFAEFVADINKCDPDVEVASHYTPNGLCVITSRGFDTRKLELEDKWSNVELKKDASRCVYWTRKF